MILAQNGPETAKSSWHCSIKSGTWKCINPIHDWFCYLSYLVKEWQLHYFFIGQSQLHAYFEEQWRNQWERNLFHDELQQP